VTAAVQQQGRQHGQRPAGARRRGWWLAMVLVPFAALAAALVTQHGFDMQPCPWCVLQRLIFTAIGITAAIGAAWSAPAPRRALALLAWALALFGIAAALWQHFVAASSASCDLTLAERIVSASGLDMALPQVFAPFASCADARVTLLGVPYEFYSLALFVALAAAAVVCWKAPGTAGAR
jgi:disulfide bond formation protein DsbB